MCTIDVIKYICKGYENTELSLMRLINLLYFIDVQSNKVNNKQLTDIDWNDINYEQSIIKEISNTVGFKIINSATIYKTTKTTVEYDGNIPGIIDEKEIINNTINSTKGLTWFELLKFVWEYENS